MNPDVYAAWQTAGDNLQQADAWLAANWINVAVAAALAAFAWWSIARAINDDDTRPRSKRQAQLMAGHEAQPDWDRQRDLATCNNILAATDSARKETP